MYRVGDLIIYGNIGVCKIEEIGVPDISSAEEGKLYYTLSPFYEKCKVYTPTDTSVFMRPIISRNEAMDLIRQIPTMQENIYENRNLSLLNEHYKTLLQSHDCSNLISLIKNVYTKRKTAGKNFKQFNQVDAQYGKRAEEMLYSEFSVALGIARNEIKGYIEASIRKMENGEIIE